jgi:signal transduction histidine kinase
MQDLLMNLLTNAVRYTPEGGAVSLSIMPVDPPSEGKNVRILVSDTGVGISEEFLPNLYEPFAQECDPRLKSSGGTGLGLYILATTSIRRLLTRKSSKVLQRSVSNVQTSSAD